MGAENQHLRSLPAGLPLPQKGVEEVRVGVKVAGIWSWFNMTPSLEASSSSPSPSPALPKPRQGMEPPPRASKRPEPRSGHDGPAHHHGRDPAKFLFTFGKYKGKRVEDAYEHDKHELAKWHAHWIDQQKDLEKHGGEPLSPQLEVAVEMVGAFLDQHERPAAFQVGRRK
jgi:hypothetical protein